MKAPDERYKGLGKPDKFMGKETDWLDWKLTFCSWRGMYDSEMDSKVRVSACFANPLSFDAFAAPIQLRRQALFHILVLSMPKGRDLDVLKSVQSSEGRNNGYEAWRRIAQIYDSASANRPMGLFTKVLKPSFHGSTRRRLVG